MSCKADRDLWDICMDNGSESFQDIMSQPDKYELQIIYTPLTKDAEGNWTMKQERLHVDTTKYFYPASTVKMPVAFLALERLRELEARGIAISKDTPLRILKSRDAQTAVHIDSTSETGLPSVGHYINKLFAVSDNDAYNRLYEFLGRDYINKTLRSKKIFSNSRVVTRVGVGGFDYEENGHTNAMQFYEGEKNIYDQKSKKATENFLLPLTGDKKGKGFFASGADIVTLKPFDMSQKNFINLVDLQESLQRIILPELYEENERFVLEDEDYVFLRNALSKLPASYDYPAYDPAEYYDSYGKFFMYGDTKDAIPDHIKIYNKVGYAYGTLTDCSYIEDEKNDIRFFLTATLQVNENGIFNDDTYEYDKGIAFLAELGRLVYAQMLESKT